MNSAVKQFAQLMLLQFREFYREPEVLFWTFAFPIGLVWILGIAFSSEGEHNINVGWIQTTNGKASLSGNHSYIATKLSVEKVFTVKNDSVTGIYSISVGSKEEGFTHLRFLPANQVSSTELLKKGIVALSIVDSGSSVSYQFDHKNSEAKLAYLLLSKYLRDVPANEIASTIIKLDTPGLRYVDFLLPGLLAMNIMSNAMWGISFSLIEKRSKKLLRRMVATPMNRMAFLFSAILARIIISFLESFVLFLFAYFYFDTTLAGGLLGVSVLIIAGNICFSGIAILASSRTAKSQVGNGLVNAVTIPMMICSGIFFSYHNFPEYIIPYIQILPLTILADSLRIIITEGGTIFELFKSTIILLTAGFATFFLGFRIYKWY